MEVVSRSIARSMRKRVRGTTIVLRCDCGAEVVVLVANRQLAVGDRLTAAEQDAALLELAKHKGKPCESCGEALDQSVLTVASSGS